MIQHVPGKQGIKGKLGPILKSLMKMPKFMHVNSPTDCIKLSMRKGFEGYKLVIVGSHTNSQISQHFFLPLINTCNVFHSCSMFNYLHCCIDQFDVNFSASNPDYN